MPQHIVRTLYPSHKIICVLLSFSFYNIFCTYRELEATWASMEFEYSPHDRTGIKLPKVSEEVVETLENDQVIEYFAIHLAKTMFLV